MNVNLELAKVLNARYYQLDKNREWFPDWAARQAEVVYIATELGVDREFGDLTRTDAEQFWKENDL